MKITSDTLFDQGINGPLGKGHHAGNRNDGDMLPFTDETRLSKGNRA